MAVLGQRSPRLPPKEANRFDAAGAVEDHAATAAAITASKADREALIATALDVSTAAKRLGVTTARIRQRLKARTLHGFKVGGVWHIPRFQFVGARASRLVPGLDEVIPHIREDADPLEVVRFMTLPQCDLEDEHGAPRTVVAWLMAGNPVDAVMALASEV